MAAAYSNNKSWEEALDKMREVECEVKMATTDLISYMQSELLTLDEKEALARDISKGAKVLYECQVVKASLIQYVESHQ